MILTSILRKGNYSFFEIGCAPGGWLVYFHKQFQFSVSGVDYAPEAYKKTIENLELLKIPAQIKNADFFNFEHAPYDIVFSSGFIEHIKNVSSVVERIISLSKPKGGIVITIIPTMHGLNWMISKTFRPKVAAGHFPISRDMLTNLHEKYGLQTLYSGYLGSFQLLPPIAKNAFADKLPLVSSIINFPFRTWNKVITSFNKTFKFYPSFSPICTKILYIGRKA